jgi:hypothetical protein
VVVGDPSRLPSGTIYPQKLTLTSPTSSCRSVGIVRSRTQATEFNFVLVLVLNTNIRLVCWLGKSNFIIQICILEVVNFAMLNIIFEHPATLVNCVMQSYKSS